MNGRRGFFGQVFGGLAVATGIVKIPAATIASAGTSNFLSDLAATSLAYESRVVLRTGGTLRGLVEYGRNFSASEYGNVFNHAMRAYDKTNKP